MLNVSCKCTVSAQNAFSDVNVFAVYTLNTYFWYSDWLILASFQLTHFELLPISALHTRS